METASRKKTNPDQLRLILKLIREGKTSVEIARSLDFSRRTYFRRRAEIERLMGQPVRDDGD
jgi:DNA-binding NarL/FixJ family response regulator